MTVGPRLSNSQDTKHFARAHKNPESSLLLWALLSTEKRLSEPRWLSPRMRTERRKGAEHVCMKISCCVRRCWA